MNSVTNDSAAEIASLRSELKELHSEVRKLYSYVDVVTEAFILFEECVEDEIGEMSFMESGENQKLKDVLNQLRKKKESPPSPPPPAPLPRPPPTPPPPAASDGADEAVLKGFQEFQAENLIMITNTDDDGDNSNNICLDLSLKRATSDNNSNTQEAISAVNNQGKKSIVAVNLNVSEMATKIDERIDADVEGNNLSQIIISKVCSVTVPDINPGLKRRPLKKKKRPSPKVVKIPKLLNNDSLRKERVHRPVTSTPDVKLPLASTSGSVSIGTAISKKKRNRRTAKKNGEKPRRRSKEKVETQSATEEKSVRKGKHMRSENPVKCPECSKGYSSRGVMRRHIKESHAQDPQFVCFYCTLKFRNGPSRLAHMHADHPNDCNQIVCTYCKRKSTSSVGLRNHMMNCAKKHGNQGATPQGKNNLSAN